MLTDNKVLYAPTEVKRTKSTKVTVIRAKTKEFKALVASRTAQLVENGVGLFPNSSSRSMYQ